MNAEKLKKLQAEVRIGGRGMPRRKKKVVHVHSAPPVDEKVLRMACKKVSMEDVPEVDEVVMEKGNGVIMFFKNPRTQASLACNTFIVTGGYTLAEVYEADSDESEDLTPEELSDEEDPSERVPPIPPVPFVSPALPRPLVSTCCTDFKRLHLHRKRRNH